jgi:hypothetical protein
MAIIQKRLSGPTQVTTANTVAYTTPLSTTTIVKQIIMTNTTASAKTATIRLKPAGVAESNTHDILSSFPLAGNETISFACSIVLVNNGNTANATNSDQLIVFANSNTAVNLTVVGLEES